MEVIFRTKRIADGATKIRPERSGSGGLYVGATVRSPNQINSPPVSNFQEAYKIQSLRLHPLRIIPKRRVVHYPDWPVAAYRDERRHVRRA